MIRAMASRLFAEPYIQADKKKTLAFVRRIHRWLVDSPSQGVINAENVSMWWRHHGIVYMGSVDDESELVQVMAQWRMDMILRVRRM